MNRRRLLALGGASLLCATSARLFAATKTGPRLLLVFLRGGYDSTNLLVPCSSAFYYEARPNIAIARPDGARDAGALALDADWALAPAVRDSIGSLYVKRQAAFIPFAGTDDLSRSHFETQDSIELGQPTNGARGYRSGFLGRLASTLSGSSKSVPAISFTDALPLVFEGATEIPNLSLKNLAKPSFDDRQTQILSAMYSGHRLEAAVKDGLDLRQELAHDMAEKEKEKTNAINRGAINAKGFEFEAERMARLMQGKYRIGFVDIGGWDTHVGEGSAQGTLANNLANFGRGLNVFAQSLGEDWDDTVVVVVSEFGRTFRENGNRGTDHGHGTVYWVLGGCVNGGRIAGEQLTVSRATLFQDRDLPVLNDYRAVLGGLFRSLWDLTPQQCGLVFPGATPRNLKLV